MLKIGITGGIGSGKSIVCAFFNHLNVPVYDADSRAKYLMQTNEDVKQNIINQFGKESYFENGILNSKFLANEVFNNNSKIETLNNIVHPAVSNDFESFCALHSTKKFIIKEAALMFENDSYTLLDKIITVFTPLSLRVQRIKKRDSHRTIEQIENIIKKQLSEEEKIIRADFCIVNDEKTLLIPQILNFFTLFSK